MYHLPNLPNPVEHGYGGGESLNIRRLQEFCNMTNSNFSTVDAAVDSLRIRLVEVNAINKQLTQLLNWIAVTNPQILDEFQTTAHAFDKLVPRNDGGEDVPCASP
jgi:hypothetical protein